MGSNLLGLYLRRRLARRLGAVAGVRTLTFIDLAGRMAVAATSAPDPGPLSSLGADLLMARTLAESARGGYFEPVRALRGVRRALLAAVRDLKDAGWSPDDLGRAIRGAKLDREAWRKLQAVHTIYSAYQQALRGSCLYDRSDLLARAVRAASESQEGGQPGVLFVYGFYDLIGLQERLLGGVCAGRETIVFSPIGVGPAFEYAKRFREWLEKEGFECGPAVPPAPADRADPDAQVPEPQALAERLFLEDALPIEERSGDRPGDDADPAVRFVSAPGRQREAIEIARLVLRWAGKGIPFRDMAILCRAGTGYIDEIARALARAHVPSHLQGGNPLAVTRAAQTAAALMTVAEQEWSPSAVLDFFNIADLEDGVAGGAPVVASEWDLIVRETGLAGGPTRWAGDLAAAIEAATARLRREEEAAAARGGAEDDEDDGGPAKLDALRRKIVALGGLREASEALGCALDGWPATGRWDACVEGFAKGLRNLVRDTPERADVLEVLARLNELDLIGPCPSREVFADLARRALDDASIPAGRFEKDGVFVGDVAAARGLRFRVVVLAEVAEGIFPARILQDPVLLDEERRALMDAMPELPRLPLKETRLEEERLVFRLAAGAAGEKLVVSWSRLGSDGRREIFPSVFARRAAGALAAALAPRDWREDPARVVTVPLAPAGGIDPALAVDFGELLAAAAANLAGCEPAVAGDVLGELLPRISRSLACESSRWSEGFFSAFDGWMAEDGASLAFERLGRGAVSPTRLEDYAACPRRTFFRRVLGIVPLDEIEVGPGIDAADRGILVHRILALFVQELTDGSGSGAVPGIEDTAGLRAALARIARAELDKAGRTEGAAYPLIWEVERERILEDLNIWLDFEIERWRADGSRPAAVEWGFGGDPLRGPLSPAPPLVLGLPGGGELTITGRIDRIDRLVGGESIRVLDYKTGQPIKGLKDRIVQGRTLQLPLYSLAAARPGDGIGARTAVGFAEYLHLGPTIVRVMLTGADLDRLREPMMSAIETLLRAARSGDFTADPRDGRLCDSCDYRAACGEDRDALFGRKRHDPHATPRLSLRDRKAPE